jgi:hypothetical protein
MTVQLVEGMLINCFCQGFAESYMLGEVSCPDLVAFFQVPIKNTLFSFC